MSGCPGKEGRGHLIMARKAQIHLGCIFLSQNWENPKTLKNGHFWVILTPKNKALLALCAQFFFGPFYSTPQGGSPQPGRRCWLEKRMAAHPPGRVGTGYRNSPIAGRGNQSTSRVNSQLPHSGQIVG